MSGRPKLVLLGMMTKIPVAGVVWQTMHYLEGFRRLGMDVYYVEAHARTPSMLMERETDDSGALAARFIDGVMRRFDLHNNWAYQAFHDDGYCFGLSESALAELYRSAEVIVNLHGGTEPRPEQVETGRLVYLETDPVQLQIELYDGRAETIEFLEQHCAFFSFGENYRAPDCGLPGSTRFDLRPTRQPVCLDFWPRREELSLARFTTVGNWRQFWRDVHLDGERYGWSKHIEFERFLDLPTRAPAEFELALSSYEPEDRALLEGRGWSVRDALPFSIDLDEYRDYLSGSLGEFSVAKDQNVRLRSGWFSDRSATYLASGRPVVTQETGFSNVLPTGDGLFAVSTVDEAAAAVERILSDYEAARRAASEVAREYFDAERVLGRMLSDLGIAHRNGKPARALLRDDLELTPVARRPLRLTEETVAAVAAARLPDGEPGWEAPEVSVVVVTHGGLTLTRLCLESVLADTDAPPYELIVLDNGSTDGTRAFLRTLARRFDRVRLVLNAENVGFPRACNQGLAVARGNVFVLLNNDTIVAPGWLRRLAAHTDDPENGLVGSVTNRIGNEAEIGATYSTYVEFLETAARRADMHAGEEYELAMPAMFCLAFRRGVYEHLGPLDERFGIGTLEDDDYALRARNAGYRLVCAEDVLVHHFGEASFGRLVPTGEYTVLLEENQRRFEEKWGVPWEPYERRENGEYETLKQRVRATIVEQLPDDSAVIVVSRGDEELLQIAGRRRGWHFPQLTDGVYAGHYPADSGDAIAQLEQLRESGGEFLVLPQTGFWWLDHYGELAEYLTEQCREVFRDDACILYALDGSVT